MADEKQFFRPLTRSFDLNRASLKEDSRTVDVVFSTETDKVERWFGYEILDHGDKSIRMDRLRNSAPLLMDHDSRDQIGVIEAASIENKQGRATVRFSKSARGEEIFQDVKDGIRSKISVGYRVHGLELERSDKKTGQDTYRVTDWEPFEISFVSIPADDAAGVRQEDSIFGQRAASLSTLVDMGKETNNTEERAEDKAPAIVAPAETQVEARSVDAQLDELKTKALIEERAAEVAREQLAADRHRASEITEVGQAFKRSEAEIKEAINKGTSVDEFKRSLLDKLKAENPAYSAGRVEVISEAPKRGTRAFTQTTWAEAAKRALGARGNQLIIPNYSDIQAIERNYIGGSSLPFHRSLTGSLTLVDKAILDEGIGAPIINEVAELIPEIRVFPVDTIAGDSVSLSVRTASPTVAFRRANEGVTPKKGTFESRLFQTTVIEELIQVDIQGVLNASKDPARLLMAESEAVTQAVLSHIAFQQWYAGTAQSGVDTKAAPGILAQSNSAATHVVDATGSTAKSSVWVLELGQYSLDHVYGNDNTLMFGDDWTEEVGEDGSGGKLRVLQNWISGRVAPRLANKQAAVRIKNLGTDSGKGLTDDLLAQAFQLARQNGMRPNAIFMTPRSARQLQVSRTTYNPVGAPAPAPEEYFGVPIYQTTSLSEAETV